MTKVRLAPIARSMAPPTAGMASGSPVCQLARSPVDRHLEGAEHADVEVAAAHHRERVGMMEIGGARQHRHRLLAGVDQVRVLFALRRRRPHAEQAVLAVQEDLAALRQEVGDQRRQADAEVDVGAFGDVALRRARPSACGLSVSGWRDLPPWPSSPQAACRAGSSTRTMRCTKMPGRDDGFGIERAELDHLAAPGRW